MPKESVSYFISFNVSLKHFQYFGAISNTFTLIHSVSLESAFPKFNFLLLPLSQVDHTNLSLLNFLPPLFAVSQPPSSGLGGFRTEFYHSCKEELIPVLLKLFQSRETEEQYKINFIRPGYCDSKFIKRHNKGKKITNHFPL